MKKTMIVFLGLFFATGILFAGGKRDTAKDPGVTTITVWHYWQEGSQREMLNHLTSNFHKDQSAVRVQPRYIAFDDFRKQLSIAAASGELPDIVIFDGVDHASYTAMGIFTDITGKVNTSRFF
jgi:multiple sugar transport system substrate-binding protein